jgi:hypothetical protein
MLEDEMSDHFQLDGDEPARKKVWINFKRDVDLGHLIATASFLVTLFLYAQGFDRRMTIVEQKQQAQTEQAAETKADIKDIKNKVTEIGTGLAVQNAIAQSGKGK